MRLQTDKGNVSTHFYSLFKQIKLELPDWSHMKDLFKSFLLVKDFFNYFEIQYDNLPFKSAAFFIESSSTVFFFR